MAVRSWPPSRARTIRPPAKPISCFVRYPKPATGNGRWSGGQGGREPTLAADQSAWRRITSHAAPGAGAPRLVMGARFGCSKFVEGFRFGIPFDLCESRSYGFSALIL